MKINLKFAEIKKFLSADATIHSIRVFSFYRPRLVVYSVYTIHYTVHCNNSFNRYGGTNNAGVCAFIIDFIAYWVCRLMVFVAY